MNAPLTRSTGHGVRVRVFNRAGRLETRERVFATEAACQKFVAKLEDSGNLHEVVAWSNGVGW